MTKLKVLFATAVGALSIGLFAGTAHAEPSPTADVGEKSVGCHPAYVQCLPITDDIDCSDPVITQPIELNVPGVDPYKLDDDGDGIGCEGESTPSTSPSPSKSPTKKPSASPSPRATKTPAVTSNGPELPRTGSNMPFIIGVGVTVLVAGSLLAFATRTRKVRVEVPKDGT